MREKLLDLMKSEGLKPSQLAELLEINPAGVSHILAGRNKPGFDLLQKILRRFPRINPDWLLLDSQQMYRTDADQRPVSLANSATTSASQQSSFTDGLFGAASSVGATPTAEAAPYSATKNAAGVASAIDQMPIASLKPNCTIRRVVIFYDDQSFESYTPSR